MKIHLKIAAAASLLFGYVIAFGFLSGQILFFSTVYKRENSVLDDGSAFQNFIKKYLEFFNEYGIDWISLLFSLLLIVLLISFGHGLLKYREWAKKIGFLIVAFNVFSFFADTVNGEVTLPYVLHIGFTGYMLYLLASNETKKYATI
jgi:hypothetical protein